MAGNNTVKFLIQLIADKSKYDKELRDAEKTAEDVAKEIDDAFKATGERPIIDPEKLSVDAEKAKVVASDAAREIGEMFAAAAAKVGAVFTAVGAGITGALGLAAKASLDFDAEFSKVATLLEGEDYNPKMLETLREGVMQVSREFGIALPEAIDAMANALSSGVPADNIVEFVRTSAIASKAGLAELADVTDVTTSIMATYGLEATEAARINDILFAGVKVGKIEYKDFAQYIGQVLPVASAAGVSLEELSGAAAALTLSGFKPATAMESLKSAISNVIKPSEQAQAAAKALGFDFSVAALESKGLQGFLSELYQKMESTPDWKVLDENQVKNTQKRIKDIQKDIDETNEKLNTAGADKKPALLKRLEDLTGKSEEAKAKLNELYTTAAKDLDAKTGVAQMFGDVSGLAAVLALGNNEMKNFNMSMDATTNAAGSAAESYKNMAEQNAKLEWDQLAKSVEQVWIAVGKLVSEAIAPLAGHLKNVVNWILDFIKENPNWSKAIIYITGIVGVLAGVFGTLLLAVSGVAAGFLAITSMQATLAAGLTTSGVVAAGSSGGFWALAAAVWAALAPILIIIVKILLVIAILALLYLALKWVSETEFGKAMIEKSIAAWGILKDVIMFVWEVIKWVGEAIGEFAFFVWDKVSGIWETIYGVFKSGVDKIADLWDKAKAPIVEFGEFLVKTIYEAAEKALGFIGNLWDKITELPGNLWDGAKNLAGFGDNPKSPNVPGFAKGGIVRSKTLAYVGEEGAEAIIPLQSGGVPVVFTGGNGAIGGSPQTNNSNVNIVVNPRENQSEESIADAVIRRIAFNRKLI